MLGFSRLEIIRKLILLIMAVLMSLRCLAFRRHGPFVTLVAQSYDETIRAMEVMFDCIAIAVIGGVLFYILGSWKQGKD